MWPSYMMSNIVVYKAAANSSTKKLVNSNENTTSTLLRASNSDKEIGTVIKQVPLRKSQTKILNSNNITVPHPKDWSIEDHYLGDYCGQSCPCCRAE